nr:zinc-dependent peptidase [Allomuricauda sp.]
MEQLTETQKQILAVFLAVGLLYVFVKIAYEHFVKERFTVFNVLHPVRRISSTDRIFIASFLLPYENFSVDQRRVFLRRFAWFKSKKPFVFYGDIQNRDHIKSYVAASAILLTMGMGNFRFERSISRIIIYPNKYYSKIARNHHVGEYNPNLKILVFSAEDLEKGFTIPNDNVNLGIHEVAHALMFEAGKSSTWDAKRFRVGLIKLRKMFDEPEFQDRLSHSDYFREYAKTNFVEFFAVMAENYVESPQIFKKTFPGLFDTVRRMLNFDFDAPAQPS